MRGKTKDKSAARDPHQLLCELARLASDMGPALAPPGYEEMLHSIATAARHLFSAAACSLALLDESRNELEFHVASGASDSDITGVRVPADKGIAGWVVSKGETISIDDVGKDPRFARDIALKTGYVPRSILAAPLKTKRRTVGVIEVLDRQIDSRADRRDMELFALFADQAALAIEHAQIFSHLGRVLLEALAESAADGDLGEALSRAAREAPSPDANLIELSTALNELSRLSADEQRFATRLVTEFLSYSKKTTSE